MRKKYIATAAVFLLFIFGLGIWHFVLPDGAVSAAERRKLAQAPELSAEALFSREFSEDLETYLLDQFPARDEFRTLKAVMRFYLFRQSDNNGVYLSGDSVFKMEYPLSEKQTLLAANKMNSVREQYLSGSDVYYAVVPDKNYFAAEMTGHPHMDYDRLMELVSGTVTGMEYVDLFSALTIDDYYRTDTHWRQESIYPAALKLAEAMGAAADMTPFEDYTAHTLSPFYGVYCGQSALPVKPDGLTYMTSAATDASIVTGAELDGEHPVYDESRFSGMDGYDVFLSGAQAVLTVSCENAASDRELVIFRDSYGSSIAPYFLGAYSKVTLVDLRYIPASMIGDYVDFHGQDVLFLYSTSLLNSGALLK